MTPHTFKMTPAEKDFARRIETTRGTLQEATIRARLRTGDRIGTSVGQEKGAPANPQGCPYNVHLVAYRLNDKGEPRGVSKITTLATGLNEAGACAFLNRYKSTPE